MLVWRSAIITTTRCIILIGVLGPGDVPARGVTRMGSSQRWTAQPSVDLAHVPAGFCCSET